MDEFEFKDYHFETLKKTQLCKTLKENFNVDFVFDENEKKISNSIQTILSSFGDISILGGIFFKYIDTYRHIHPRLFEDFTTKRAIDIFTSKPFTELQVCNIFQDLDYRISQNINHHYFFHDRNSYQHEVLNLDISSFIKSKLTPELKKYLGEGKINLKFSPTAGAACIMENFDFDPCKIAYIPSKEDFVVSRYFFKPFQATPEGMDLFGKAPCNRFLKILMKGFLTPKQNSMETKSQKIVIKRGQKKKPKRLVRKGKKASS